MVIFSVAIVVDEIPSNIALELIILFIIFVLSKKGCFLWRGKHRTLRRLLLQEHVHEGVSRDECGVLGVFDVENRIIVR